MLAGVAHRAQVHRAKRREVHALAGEGEAVVAAHRAHGVDEVVVHFTQVDARVHEGSHRAGLCQQGVAAARARLAVDDVPRRAGGCRPGQQGVVAALHHGQFRAIHGRAAADVGVFRVELFAGGEHAHRAHAEVVARRLLQAGGVAQRAGQVSAHGGEAARRIGGHLHFVGLRAGDARPVQADGIRAQAARVFQLRLGKRHVGQRLRIRLYTYFACSPS